MSGVGKGVATASIAKILPRIDADKNTQINAYKSNSPGYQ